jgi:iron(III) transport system substrate-binding protein
MKYLLFFFLTVSLLALPVASYGQARAAWQIHWEKTVEGAKREGQVVIYHGSDLEQTFAEFHKKYPEIKVVSVTGATGPGGLSQRIMTEQRADKFLGDVYVLGATTAYMVLYKGNAFDPIKPALILPEVTDESKWLGGRHRYIDEQGQYILSFIGEFTPYYAYNTKLVDPVRDFTSYWDLLNPKWKGKMVALDPTWGGPVASPLRFIYYHPELGPNFLKRLLSEMEITPSRDTTQIVNWLATGKYLISLFTIVSRTGLDDAKRHGVSVDWFGPKVFKEGTILGGASGNVMLMRNAPHPNAARLAINWLLSREGQTVYQRVHSADSRRLDIPKDDVPREKRRVEGVRFVETDTPETMDIRPILQFTKEVFKPKKP